MELTPRRLVVAPGEYTTRPELELIDRPDREAASGGATLAAHGLGGTKEDP